MKQAKSRTKRKSKPYEKLGFTKHQVNQAADLTTQYLKAWTDRELHNLVYNKNVPVCLPLGNHGFLIGRYKLEKIHDQCWRVSSYSTVISDFTSKVSAACYAIAEQLNHLNLASLLLKTDNLVGKLEMDQINYQHAIRRGIKKGDYFKVDLAKLRYLDCNYQLQAARRELEKTINTAKYLKVQERLL